MPDSAVIENKFHVQHRTNMCADICDSAGYTWATFSWSLKAGERAEEICMLMNVAHRNKVAREAGVIGNPITKPVPAGWFKAERVNAYGRVVEWRQLMDGHGVPLYTASELISQGEAPITPVEG